MAAQWKVFTGVDQDGRDVGPVYVNIDVARFMYRKNYFPNQPPDNQMATKIQFDENEFFWLVRETPAQIFAAPLIEEGQVLQEAPDPIVYPQTPAVFEPSP